MFVKNKYYQRYLALVAVEGGNDYCERHHIVPSAMGDGNQKSNIARLTPRRHFIAHWLLTKCTEGADRKRMLHALGCMVRNPNGGRNLTARQYEIARRAKSEAMRGNPSPMKGKTASAETRAKISAASKGRPSPWKGKSASAETRAKISAANKGAVRSAEFKARVAEIHRGNKHRLGQSPSLETREKLSASLIGNKRSVGRTVSKATREKMSVSHLSNARPQSNNRIGLKGVHRHQGRFRAKISVRGNTTDLGMFDCPAVAHIAYVLASNLAVMAII